MRRIIQRLAVVALMIGAVVAAGLGVLVGAPRGGVAADVLPETVLGEAGAPVTVLEYSSLTCPHCAAFHTDTLPRLKETYIDSGKVRLVYRDFPLDRLALAAAVIAHCVDPQRYFGFLEMLYRDQESWTRSADPLAELKVRAQLAGLSEAGVDACLSNQPLIAAVQQRAKGAQQEYGIDSTPSFIVAGKKIAGEQSFENFAKAIDAALAESR